MNNIRGGFGSMISVVFFMMWTVLVADIVRGNGILTYTINHSNGTSTSISLIMIVWVLLVVYYVEGSLGAFVLDVLRVFDLNQILDKHPMIEKIIKFGMAFVLILTMMTTRGNYLASIGVDFSKLDTKQTIYALIFYNEAEAKSDDSNNE